MQYYFQFWKQVHQITHNNVNSNQFKHSLYLSHPLAIHYTPEVAFNFLLHHCGVHYKIIQYLLNRRLILSGYTKQQTPVIAFIQRVPANHQIAKHLTIPNPYYKNDLSHDILLAKQIQPKQGMQDEEPIGVEYLFLIPTHYQYNTTHGKHHLLEINLLKGNKGYAEYRVMKGNSFNIRVGQHPNKIIFTTNPIESICYFQLHLKQHKLQQNTLIITSPKNNQAIHNILCKNYLYNRSISKIFAPNHHLSSQNIINKYNSHNKNIKVIYPIKYRTWLKMLQQETFNGKHFVFIDNLLTVKQNIQLINYGLSKYLGEYGTQCLSLMLHVLSKSYQNKINHKYEPLNSSNIRIQSYMVIRKQLSHKNLYFIKQYMNNIGHYYPPSKVSAWFHKLYISIYHKRNSMLNTPTFKYIDNLQYHTSKELVTSLRKQGKQMLKTSMNNKHFRNHQHYQSKQDKIMHVKRFSNNVQNQTKRDYQIKYNHNRNDYENRN